MKKLIQKSTMALLILSLFVVSCEKEKAIPAPIPLKSEITYTHKSGQKIKGDNDTLMFGLIGTYSISVFKHGPEEEVNCKGTWSYDVNPEPTDKYQDPVTGRVVLSLQKEGVYVINIIFTPCTGKPSKIKITIVVG